MDELKVPGFPYCVLLNSSGLIAWAGHPSQRKLDEDIYALLNNQILFETDEQDEDPEYPKQDPDDQEIDRKDGVEFKKAERLEMFDEMQRKIIFF